jgi:hypothetical protein
MAGVASIMATIKVFSLGGLDKKSNDLTRAVDKASEMVNMEYDTSSTIKKRNGYTETLINSSNVAAFDDLIYYNSKDEILGFTKNSANIKVINNSTKTLRTFPIPSGVLAQEVSISSCENQNNLYFTNTDYSSYVMKYDGSNIYRSGLPTPRISQALVSGYIQPDSYPTMGTPGAGYTRIFYSYKDINGNISYSPYVEYAQSYYREMTINSFKNDPNCMENGFFDKYCYRFKAAAQTIDSGANELILSRHNYIAGDKFLVDSENKFIKFLTTGKDFLVLEVESVKHTVPDGVESITFTLASIGSNQIVFLASIFPGVDYPVDVRCKIYVAHSSMQATNYTITSSLVLDNSVTQNVFTDIGTSDNTIGGNLDGIPFENLYDSAYRKCMPPICKYISSFGDQIVYGSIQSYFTIYSHTNASPNASIQFANTSLVTYSDRSTGDGPEGVSDFNFTKIGETWDGDITGMRRCNDSLIIFKNRGIFSIDGDLVNGQFALRKINTNFIGCTSHKSISESEEGLYFQAHNGIYYTNGIGVQKLTYELDSLFLSKDYTSTRSVIVKKKQKSMFYIPDIAAGTSRVVVIDYYYQQVYMWSFDKPMGSGIISDKNGDVYFCDGLKLFKFSDLYSDNGVAISSVYATTWHHAGEPSLNKKWNSIRTWGLTGDAFTARVTTEGDWQAGTVLTSNDSVYGTTTQTDFKMLNMQTKRALRVLFSNSTNDENMVLTGYELTYEVFNGVDKN